MSKRSCWLNCVRETELQKQIKSEVIMKRRVVVTGLGAVTPIGNTVEAFWASVKKGTVGIGEILSCGVLGLVLYFALRKYKNIVFLPIRN